MLGVAQAVKFAASAPNSSSRIFVYVYLFVHLIVRFVLYKFAVVSCVVFLPERLLDVLAVV